MFMHATLAVIWAMISMSLGQMYTLRVDKLKNKDKKDS